MMRHSVIVSLEEENYKNVPFNPIHPKENSAKGAKLKLPWEDRVSAMSNMHIKIR